MSDQADHNDGTVPENTKKAKRASTKPKRKSGGWFGKALIFVLVLAIGGAGSLAGYLYWTENYVLTSSIPDHSSEITEIVASIEVSEAKLATLSQELQEFGGLLETRLNEQATKQTRKDLRLSGELSALREQIENVRMNLRNSPDAKAIEDIVLRLDKIEQIPLTASGDADGLQENVLTGLRDRFSSVEASVKAFGAEIERMKSLRSRIDDNVRAISEIRSELRAELADLRGSGLAEVSGSTVADAVDRSGVAMALVSIESMSRRGEPFEFQYAKLEQAIPSHPGLIALKPFAKSGVKTFAELQTGFDEAKGVAMSIELKPTRTDLNWLSKVFGDGVRVKADISQSSLVERLSLASEFMDAGNLVATLEILKGYPDPAFDEWVELAHNRVTLEASIELLRQDLLNAQR